MYLSFRITSNKTIVYDLTGFCHVESFLLFNYFLLFEHLCMLSLILTLTPKYYIIKFKVCSSFSTASNNKTKGLGFSVLKSIERFQKLSTIYCYLCMSLLEELYGLLAIRHLFCVCKQQNSDSNVHKYFLMYIFFQLFNIISNLKTKYMQ